MTKSPFVKDSTNQATKPICIPLFLSEVDPCPLYSLIKRQSSKVLQDVQWPNYGLVADSRY